MNKKLSVLLVVMLVLSVLLPSCDETCTTGIVDNKYVDTGNYYLVINVRENMVIITGDIVHVSVDNDFYNQVRVGDYVTACSNEV